MNSTDKLLLCTVLSFCCKAFYCFHLRQLYLFYNCLWNFLFYKGSHKCTCCSWLSCSSRLDARAVSLLDVFWANKWLIDWLIDWLKSVVVWRPTGTVTWRTSSKHNVGLDAGPLVPWYENIAWRHPQNRKHIAYRNADRGKSSTGTRPRVSRIKIFGEVRPRRCDKIKWQWFLHVV